MQTKINTEASEDFKNKVTDAKINSSNLYDVPGYLIDEKGDIISGKLSINFEDITIKIDISNIESLPENYGKNVYIKTLNDKGKEKTIKYKSNNGIKFCTDEGDYYIGIKTYW